MTRKNLILRSTALLVVVAVILAAWLFAPLTVESEPPVEGWAVLPQSQFGRFWGIDPNGPNGLVGFGTDVGLVTLAPDGVWTLYDREHITFDVAFRNSLEGNTQLCGAQLNLGAYCVDLATGEASPWHQGIILPERSEIQYPAELITYIHTLETDQDGNLWLAGLRCKSRYNCESVFLRTNGSWVMEFKEGQPVWVRDAHVYSFVPYRNKFLVNTMWGGVLQFDLYRSNFDPSVIHQPPGIHHLFSLDMAIEEEMDKIVVADLNWLWQGSLLDNRHWTNHRPPDFQDWQQRYPSDQFHQVAFVGDKIWTVIHRTDGSGRLMEYDTESNVWTEIFPPGVVSWAGPSAGPAVDSQGRVWLAGRNTVFVYNPNSPTQPVASNMNETLFVDEDSWSNSFEVNRNGEIVFFNNDQMR